MIIQKYVPAWMPFTNFLRFGRKGRQLDRDLREVPFAIVKSQIVSIFLEKIAIRHLSAGGTWMMPPSRIYQSY